MKITVAAFFLLVPSALAAQLVPDSIVNQRVRIHLIEQAASLEGVVPRQELRGTMMAVSADSIKLSIHPEAAPLSVAVSGIHQIDTSRGVSRTRTAIRKGLLVAATWGVLSAVDEETAGGRAEDIVLWSASGFALGAMIGAAFPAEGWRRVFRR